MYTSGEELSKKVLAKWEEKKSPKQIHTEMTSEGCETSLQSVYNVLERAGIALKQEKSPETRTEYRNQMEEDIKRSLEAVKAKYPDFNVDNAAKLLFKRGSPTDLLKLIRDPGKFSLVVKQKLVQVFGWILDSIDQAKMEEVSQTALISALPTMVELLDTQVKIAGFMATDKKPEEIVEDTLVMVRTIKKRNPALGRKFEEALSYTEKELNVKKEKIKEAEVVEEKEEGI